MLYVYRYGKPGPHSVTLLLDTKVLCPTKTHYRTAVAYHKARLGADYAGVHWRVGSRV